MKKKLRFLLPIFLSFLFISSVVLAQSFGGGIIVTPSHWFLDGTTLSPTDDANVTVSIATLSVSGTVSGDLFVANGNGAVIGHSSQITVGALLSEFQILGTGAADSSRSLFRASEDANTPLITFTKSRATAIGSFAAVADNDVIGLSIGCAICASN